MSEAQRLNMVGGHFIWLWADTSSTTEFYDTASSSSPVRAPVGSLRGADVPPGSPSQSAANGARDKSRIPVVTSSSSSMGRQRENDRRTDQRVPGKGRKQQQGDSRRENEQNNDNNSKVRERFHLPVAGRSRPAVSEQDDKSRSKRDLANPIVESSSQASVSSSNNEQLAGGDNGQFYYDEEELFDSEEHHSLDSEDVEEDAQSERRILEMLGKAPAKHQQHYTNNGGDGEEAKGEEEESIRLTEKETKTVDGDHNKWTARGNQTSSADPAAAKSPPSDIDPVIKAEGDFPEDEEEVAKLKRMLNLANMNNSDVLFHHFKDFPIGLLALRPVRMDVDRHFIKATVQLFANTWKRIDGGTAGRATEQSRSWQFDGERWKRKRRRKRDVGEEEGSVLNTSDKLDVMDSSGGYGREGAAEELFNGANTEEVEDDDDKLGQIVVNNTLNQQNQSFNASDLGQRVHYYRRVLLRDPNASSITSNGSHESRSSDTVTFYGAEEETEEESSGGNGYAVDGGNSTEDMAISDSPTTDHVVDGEPSETGAVPADLIMMGLGSGGAAVDSDKHQQRDDSGLHVDYNSKPSASGSYLRGGNIAMLYGNIPAESFGSEVEGISTTRGSEDTLSNMKIKTKRKYGASEQQEVNRIRSGGAHSISATAQRQQILGSWTKVGGDNNNSGGRSRLGSPQYSGGCYGTPTKNDARRAESFARYVRTHATCF